MKYAINVKTIITVLFLIVNIHSSGQQKTLTLTKDVLKDKIKGGWAGQTIGVTFGGPYEFRFQGSFIGDYQPLLWYDGYLKKTMTETPGLYDDLYMDLTFVEVFERLGLDAPIDSFANAYAKAGYMLWHANQAGRYNILHGIKAPESGHWLNNPHADCIDYQIEADFAGLMSPGMPNTASAISDKIGHIMNYGDGWYGGIFVGAMYATAFNSKDVNFIVSEALKTIPKQSLFYQCIADVIAWHKKYPNDWKQTWFEVQKKWANDIGCPEGVFLPFNIDATVNSAYCVIGLLYGGGDFTKSLEITTRCGQDADCNPSTVGGVLGTVLGYDAIPAYWKLGLKEIEDMDFKYTTMSLNDVYETGYRHALKNIEQKGGKVTSTSVTLPAESPVSVRFEQSFAGSFPVSKTPGQWTANDSEFSFDFEGTGFVVRGRTTSRDTQTIYKTQVFIDGALAESPDLPEDFTTRRYEICWKYQMPKGKHSVKLKILNPPEKGKAFMGVEALIYSDKPVVGINANVK